ncbi:MAG TPA: Stk1 family PASTA domain-containing Ser/Thr kinase [Acidimicrobiales bacterium]|nr:Stk1 family PASTA domain-containing Ser/Thr kinase [Acidimicrobiales bacterium]
MSQSDATVLNRRYELQRRVGRGGMADVFLARDQLLDRPVALKVLFPEFAQDPAFVERFRREAQAAANLNHPNIVSVYDWGEAAGTYYIVMEYIDGRSLADVLRTEGRIRPDRAIDATVAVALALASAHTSGVIHRDIKPANILITRDGQVKVADFGIARALNTAHEQDLTQAGSVMGTASYFSPEQAQGHQLDPRSDLYSLGVVLYEMLTGKPPFTGENPVSIAYKQVHERPVPPSQIVPTTPPGLEGITLQLLAKDPADRYANCGDLITDLRRVRAGKPPLGATAARGTTAENEVTAAEAATAAAVAAGAGQATQNVDPTAYQPTRVEPAVPRTQNVPVTEYEEVDDGPRHHIGIWVLVILVLAGLGLMAWLLTSGKLDNKGAAEKVNVPSVLNMKSADATSALQGQGFKVQAHFEQRDDVDADIVFAQSPDPNTSADKGSTVTITASSGSAPVKLPNVVGLQQADAVAKLEGINMQTNIVTVTAEDQAEGTVLAQNPPPGEAVPTQTVVTLQVAGPPDQIAIPDVAGQDQLSAAATLGRNFQVETKQQASDSVAVGRVIATDPPAGTQVARDSTVTMIISAGTPVTTVPNLIGLTQSAALDQLTNAGLQMDTQFVNLSPGDPRIGLIVAQNPDPGVKADTGLIVNVVVGRDITGGVGSSTTFPGGGSPSTSILFGSAP